MAMSRAPRYPVRPLHGHSPIDGISVPTTMLEPMSCGLPFPTECVTANVWSGGLGLLLVLSGQWGALAQSSNEDLRKRYIGCAALFGAVSTMVPDGKAKDNLATASILLLTW